MFLYKDLDMFGVNCKRLSLQSFVAISSYILSFFCCSNKDEIFDGHPTFRILHFQSSSILVRLRLKSNFHGSVLNEICLPFKRWLRRRPATHFSATPSNEQQVAVFVEIFRPSRFQRRHFIKFAGRVENRNAP